MRAIKSIIFSLALFVLAFGVGYKQGYKVAESHAPHIDWRLYAYAVSHVQPVAYGGAVDFGYAEYRHRCGESGERCK